MSTSLLYHTQGIAGFQHQSFIYEGVSVVERISRKTPLTCPECSSYNVSLTPIRTRRIQCNNCGQKLFYIEAAVHQIYCRNCKGISVEHLPFLSHPKARISLALERTIVELRSDMSISAISKHFGVDWRTVKDCEKHYLEKKFRVIKLKNIRIIGVDEIYVTRVKGKEKYITVVRDIETGAVLYVGKGKGVESLEDFGKRLRHSRCKIKAIAMDMSKSYTAWARENIPDAEIVFDHFHIIKLMNEKVDTVRRKTCVALDEEQRKLLKNQRFLFLRNVEDLGPDAEMLLKNLRNMFKDLGDVSMFKEALRTIYRKADTDFQAEAAFKNWCTLARATEVKELEDMAKTIENNLTGITAYWRMDGLTNSSMEGFNNKIRWLIRQAYGFRDDEYFTLKIYNLPNTKTEAEL